MPDRTGGLPGGGPGGFMMVFGTGRNCLQQSQHTVHSDQLWRRHHP